MSWQHRNQLLQGKMAVYWGSSSASRSSRHKNRDLPSEFRLFTSFTKQLKKIIYDSNISLAELRSSGHFEEGRRVFSVNVFIPTEVKL